MIHNTDTTGLYNPREVKRRTPRIRATALTDAQGRYQILTVRPAAYPNGDDPAHVHYEVIATGYHLRYSTLWFDGDPLITPKKLEEMRKQERKFPRDTCEIVKVETGPDGFQRVRHDITLESN